jgi:glycosyltransferase involved in cell wall biosynthesis
MPFEVLNPNLSVVISPSDGAPRQISPGRLKVALVSTFPPRACGLATFASDLAVALEGTQSAVDVKIVALQRSDRCQQPLLHASSAIGEVKDQSARLADIHEDDVGSYRLAADATNDWADVVLIQHEFGIFGGEDGEHLLEYVRALTVPFIITLHTVLPRFSPHQSELLTKLCTHASSVTVFTTTALRLLCDQAIVDESRVEVVPHGAPEVIYDAYPPEAKASLGMDDRFVLSSFGLVSKGKGLELAIEALPQVCLEIPNVHLIIAGRTHPDIVRSDGETYRESLHKLAEDLGVSDRVTFMDGFLSIEVIAGLLAATDIFVTPYVNLDQIVSGALTFALASGCPVVSTPYLYAIDQLADGGGVIVPGRSPSAFAEAITTLATRPNLLEARCRATEIGASMRWSAVGERLAALASSDAKTDYVRRDVQVLTERAATELVPLVTPLVPAVASFRVVVPPLPLAPVPMTPVTMAPALVDLTVVERTFPTRHLRRLVDDRGVIQHATGVVPLLSSGYCVDDIARLIPLAQNWTGNSSPTFSDYWESVFVTCIAVLSDAHQTESANMRNFMTWSGEWIDEPHFGDHVGRALQGLAAVPNTAEYMIVVKPLVAAVLRNWPEAPALHPDAYALIAQARAPHLADLRSARGMLDRLLRALQSNSSHGWHWFESTVRYDQGRLPHALLAGGRLLGDEAAVAHGLETLAWLTHQCDQQSYLRFPGHRGLGQGEPLQWSGDEQPLEALAFIEAHRCAYEITGDRIHIVAATRGIEWFTGANRLGQSLVNEQSGACCDGLGSFNVNENCGAESSLAWAHANLHLPTLKRHDHPSVLPVTV